ncbi:MAG: hypothetical protein V3R99_08210 [Thermoguttaceae bacterium]
MRRSSAVLFLTGIVSLSLIGCGGPSDSSRPKLSAKQRVDRALKDPVPESRAKALVRIGYEQSKAKDEYGSEETLKLAAKASAEIPDPAIRASVWSMLAEAHQRIGNRGEARGAVQSALTAAGEVDDVESKANALARTGRAQGVTGDVDGALKTLAEAERLAGELGDAYGEVLVLGAAASSYHKIGKPQQADRALATALERGKTIEDDLQRCQALGDVAARQHSLEIPTARETFDLAVKTAREIDKVYAKAHAMADLAQKLSKAGYHAQTHEILEEADQAANKIPEPDLQRQTVEKVRTLMGTLPLPAE